jgi:hypothetical protein
MVANFEHAYADYRRERGMAALESVTRAISDSVNVNASSTTTPQRKRTVSTDQTPSAPVQPASARPVTPTRGRDVVRVMNWNIEWMECFFKVGVCCVVTAIIIDWSAE